MKTLVFNKENKKGLDYRGKKKQSHVILLYKDMPVFQIRRWARKEKFEGWVYLGKDYRILKTWDAKFGKLLPRISTNKMLSNTAWRLRQSFISWTADIGKPYWSSIEWWISLVREKSTLVSPLFLNVCLVDLSLQFVREKKSVVIVIEDWAVFETVRLILKKEEIYTYTPIGKNVIKILNALKRIVRFLGSWGLYLIKLLKTIWIIRSTRKKKQDFKPKGQTVIIHTCIDEGSLKESGHFYDRYFPGLADWLHKEGYHVVILPLLIQTNLPLKDLYNRIRNSNYDFLIIEDYLSLRDYINAAITVLKTFRIPNGKVSFWGMEITPLINNLRWSQARNVDNIRFLTYGPVLKKIKESEWNIRLFIDKFENMSKEKPQILALKEHFPLSTIIGFQHAAMPPFMLKYSSREDEFNNGLFPDYIVANGAWFYDQMIKDGIPKSRLRIGPSLRYYYLFDELVKDYSKKVDNKKNINEKIVLVALSMEWSMCLELLEVVLDAVNRCEYKVWLKAHPMIDCKQIQKLLGYVQLPDNVSWVEDNIKNCLVQSDCVVAMGSAVLMEAVAFGVLTIVVGRECGLDMNPLGWWSDEIPEFRPVFSAEKLREAIQLRLNMNSTDYDSRVDLIKKKILSCYSAVSEKNMNAFTP